MYKLIACDLDETLLNTEKEICEENIKAIKKAEKEYQIRFVPATGRGYTCIDNVLHTLGVYDAEDEYTISNNGGVVTENKAFRELSFHALPFSLAEKLFDFGYQKDVCIQVFTAKDVYAFHLNEDERKWLFSFKPDSIECNGDNIDFLKDTPITKILFQNTDTAYLQELSKELKPIIGNDVSITFSSNRYMEMNLFGVDKGLGLRDLCNYLGIDISETIAIGDNFNDIGMLREAGLSVAVANAVDEIKNLCDYVCEKDHNNGAVAEVIERFIFNNESL